MVCDLMGGNFDSYDDDEHFDGLDDVEDEVAALESHC